VEKEKIKARIGLCGIALDPALFEAFKNLIAAGVRVPQIEDYFLT
jgi:hypothetical protein